MKVGEDEKTNEGVIGHESYLISRGFIWTR